MKPKDYLVLWNERNPGKMQEYRATWKQKNPEKFLEGKRRNEQMRRARLRGGGYLSRQTWERVKVEYDYKCVLCGTDELSIIHIDGKELTVDHRLPVSKGGTNEPLNLQPLCMNCNNFKRENVL